MKAWPSRALLLNPPDPRPSSSGPLLQNKDPGGGVGSSGNLALPLANTEVTKTAIHRLAARGLLLKGVNRWTRHVKMPNFTAPPIDIYVYGSTHLLGVTRCQDGDGRFELQNPLQKPTGDVTDTMSIFLQSMVGSISSREGRFRGGDE